MSQQRAFGVVILAQHEDALVFVRSERAAIGESIVELPRGFAESTRPIPGGAIADALRELREETGWVGTKARVLGSYYTDTTTLPNLVCVVHCLVSGEPQLVPDGEVSEIVRIPRAHIAARIATGELHDAHTLSALALGASAGVVRISP